MQKEKTLKFDDKHSKLELELSSIGVNHICYNNVGSSKMKIILMKDKLIF